jgi:osmotically-inducible protein OsmY
VPARADDLSVRKHVERRLEKAGLVQEGDIQVSVSGGAVTLEGAVTTVDAQRRAESLARKESKTVVNRLEVLPAARSEAQIRKSVTSAILSYPRYTIFDALDFDVVDGAVILRGSVQQPYRRDDIENRVAKLAGVRQVRNEIRVQPVSVYDEQLRRQLARLIYGSDLFSRFAQWPNPPVHILVERGNVTLVGAVSSRVEQAALGHIARQTLAFGVDNQVQIESEQQADHKS